MLGAAWRVNLANAPRGTWKLQRWRFPGWSIISGSSYGKPGQQVCPDEDAHKMAALRFFGGDVVPDVVKGCLLRNGMGPTGPERRGRCDHEQEHALAWFNKQNKGALGRTAFYSTPRAVGERRGVLLRLGLSKCGETAAGDQT